MGQSDSTSSSDPAKTSPRRGWIRWLIALCGVALFWELIIELDLIPFYLLLPKIALLLLAGLGVVLVALVLLRSFRKHGRVQFSMISIMTVTLMVAWSVARLGHEAKRERQIASVQEKHVNSLLAFGAKKLTFGGRYSDGHRDTAARYLFVAFGSFLDSSLLMPGAIPLEMAYVAEVDLSLPTVDDKTIPTLVATGTIERLNLSNTKITDAALDELAKLESLRYLEISNTAVTPGAIEKMRELRPDVEVTR